MKYLSKFDDYQTDIPDRTEEENKADVRKKEIEREIQEIADDMGVDIDIDYMSSKIDINGGFGIEELEYWLPTISKLKKEWDNL